VGLRSPILRMVRPRPIRNLQMPSQTRQIREKTERNDLLVVKDVNVARSRNETHDSRYSPSGYLKLRMSN
jgi:polynucleotide 5'-kinase involved in rRNA processing